MKFRIEGEKRPQSWKRDDLQKPKKKTHWVENSIFVILRKKPRTTTMVGEKETRRDMKKRATHVKAINTFHAGPLCSCSSCWFT